MKVIPKQQDVPTKLDVYVDIKVLFCTLAATFVLEEIFIAYNIR
jgi:hypothetical protein